MSQGPVWALARDRTDQIRGLIRPETKTADPKTAKPPRKRGFQGKLERLRPAVHLGRNQKFFTLLLIIVAWPRLSRPPRVLFVLNEEILMNVAAHRAYFGIPAPQIPDFAPRGWPPRITVR